MVMALILLFMAIETQIWNSDGGALTSPPALLFISDEKKRWLVAESSQSNSQVLVEPGDTSLVQISPIRLPPGPSVLIGPQCPGWGQFLIGGDSGDRVTLTTVLVTCQTPASPQYGSQLSYRVRHSRADFNNPIVISQTYQSYDPRYSCHPFIIERLTTDRQSLLDDRSNVITATFSTTRSPSPLPPPLALPPSRYNSPPQPAQLSEH